jgi:uncharacterized protein
VGSSPTPATINLKFMQSLFWNSQIVLLLTISIIAIVICVKQLGKNWREYRTGQKALRFFIGSFFVICLSLLIYGTFIEPGQIKITQTDINLNQTPQTENLKIVQLSDLHSNFLKKQPFFNRVLTQVETINPDMIILTGDYIYTQESEADYLTEFLTKLGAEYPVYAVTGNHEYGQSSWKKKIHDKSAAIKRIFNETNVKLIDNLNETVEINGAKFVLSGIQDVWSQPDVPGTLNKLLADNTDNLPQFLLAHNPEVIMQTESGKFDMIFSGHTHAGQIRLPLIGSLAPLPIQLDSYYDQGLFKLNGGNYLYINAGLGEGGPHARLFNPPEISVFNIDL